MIPAALSFLGGFSVKTYLVGAAVVGIVSWFSYSEIVKSNRASEIRTLTIERDEAKRIAVQNALVVDRVKADHAKAMAAAKADADARRRRQQAQDKIRSEIARDPDARQPVSPAIRRYLERMRSERDPAAGTPAR